MTRIVVRVDHALMDAVDAMVAEGVAGSRAAIARRAVEELADRHQRAMMARRIVEEFTQRPQTDGEIGWSEAGTVAMIAAEPW